MYIEFKREQSQKKSKELIQKIEQKVFKSYNFTRSKKEKSNIVIAILEKTNDLIAPNLF